MERESRKINWYPGHMTKAKRMIVENVKLVDFVVEILDARIPYSSRNPDFKTLFKDKKKIIILNKYDLADIEVTKKWVAYYNSNDTITVCMNSKTGKGIKEFFKAVDDITYEKHQKMKAKGMLIRPDRAMICGIPNSGKSTFINKLTGKAPAKTGDKPGVTRDRQWIKIHKNIHFIDTPGLLWPKLEPEKTALNLAFTGAINDDILDIERISLLLINYLKIHYPDSIKNRYSIDISEIRNIDDHEILDMICENRKFIKSGGIYDTEKASVILLDEFRAGKLGEISLEEPDDFY